MNRKQQNLKQQMQQIEQLRVQMAGIATAAQGYTSGDVVAQPGDYGWSVPYQDVLELRRKYDTLRVQLDAERLRSDKMQDYVNAKDDALLRLRAQHAALVEALGKYSQHSMMCVVASGRRICAVVD